eukprot:TRINITY_DN1590_c0_g2_i1.p2 TRINITY_DN1590_c0_g2~~TRINITY_DN1590_c0_g2_i1.p2  ORF type:complete len:253 (+),score=96.62 TRINITY_DN1590_c0_g2_i1:100-759(+)
MCIRDRYNFTSGQVVQDSTDKAQYRTVSAPLNTTAPTFLSAGKIVYIQDVEGVNSTRDLDNEFAFVVGLNKTGANFYTAFGTFMPLTNYLNVEEVNQCLDQNCLLTVSANVFEYSSSVHVVIDFYNNDTQAEPPADQLKVTQVKLYGFKFSPQSLFVTDGTDKVLQGTVKKNGDKVKDITATFTIEESSNSGDFTLTLDVTDFYIENHKQLEFVFQVYE